MNRFLGVSLLLLWVLPGVVDGAMLYLDPPRGMLQQGDAVLVSVRLDVDQDSGECVNAVDVVLTYPDEIQAVDTSTGKSIFPLWVESPTIDQERNQITFAGGIPNGYCGRIDGDPGLTNVLAEVVFRATPQSFTDEEEGAGMSMPAVIEFTDATTVYLNDGRGTQQSPETFGTTLGLLPTSGVEIRDPWREIIQADTRPPEEFSIQLERDERVFDGDYFIVFNTTDKQSGVATYEVMEEPLAEQHLFRFGEVGAAWREAKSPYRLEDQSLNSTIRVRATDKAGNEYVATLVPDVSLRTRVIHPMEWILLVGGGGLLVLFGWLLVRTYRGSRNGKLLHDSNHDVTTDHDGDNSTTN